MYFYRPIIISYRKCFWLEALPIKLHNMGIIPYLGECYAESVKNCNQLALDCNFSKQRQLQYLHNLLFKVALKMFFDAVWPIATNITHLVGFIGDEYISPVRRVRIENQLQSLQVSLLVSKEMEISATSAAAYKTTSEISPQVPPSHRGEAHRIEYLRHVVVSYP